MAFKADIEIAREATKKPIMEIGAKLGIPAEHLLPYGHDKGKVGQAFIESLQEARPMGKLILVTAGINPTPAGEGKTTTTVAIREGLNRICKKAIICISESSLGQNYGMKERCLRGRRLFAGRADGRDEPAFLLGDFHAITSAHNLLAAMVDNHIHLGQPPGPDRRAPCSRGAPGDGHELIAPCAISWCRRAALLNGSSRHTGFDITAASEVMAIL